MKWHKWDHGQAKVYCRKCAKASNTPFNLKQHMEQLFPKVARSQRETSIPCVPRLYHSRLTSAAIWGLTELSRQVMIEIPGPAPCVVCGSQWRTVVRSTIVSCILLSLRCSPASSVLPRSVQGRSWIITIERSMLGNGHFSVSCVQMPSNISRTCPTTSRWSTRAYLQL